MKAFALLLLLSTTAFDRKKPDPADYKDGMLVSLKEVITGKTCSHYSLKVDDRESKFDIVEAR
ncbi:hypothetical protein RBB78_09850 [Tunturiibacter empetritectus]